MTVLWMKFFEWYYALLHSIPFLSLLINIAITDMTIEIKHWWIAVLVLCPAYMLFNLTGGFVYGTGTCYGIENWFQYPGITLVLFVVGAFV